MTNITNITAKTQEDYFSILKERNFTKMLTVGVTDIGDEREYSVLPSEVMSIEDTLGMLHLASDAIKYGGEV